MTAWENVFLAATSGSWAVFAIFLLFGKNAKAGLFGLIPLAVHLSWIVYRSIFTGHAPFANLYESLVFFSFLLFLKAVTTAWNRRGFNGLFFFLPGFAVLLPAVFMHAGLKTSGRLMPALQSAWMFLHVPAVFYAYVSLTFAFAIKLRDIAGKKDSAAWFSAELKQAFFFLGLGIISGAFWAQNAWAAFWSWDAKEVWALVTWLLTGLAFHVRSNRGRMAVVSLAFSAMLFTYFGVTFLLPGLHSYLR
jgi:ABC-type transport system involved in cytochrome c biogenesis permease subunit